jgi:hypothetical protein
MYGGRGRLVPVALRNLTRIRHNLSAAYGIPLRVGYIGRHAVLTEAPLPGGGIARLSSGIGCGDRTVGEQELERQLAYQLGKALEWH